MAKKTSSGEVNFKALTGPEREAFEQSRLMSRFVVRWKPVANAADIAKSRWTVLGFEDPDIHEISRSSPTPTTRAVYGALQVAAGRKQKVRISDVKVAFTQSRRSDRPVPLCAEQPEGGWPGLHPEQLLVLETEVYGLISGP